MLPPPDRSSPPAPSWLRRLFTALSACSGLGSGGIIDAWLWKRDLRLAPIRLILRIQIGIAVLSLVAGLVLLPWTRWGIWFGLASSLSVWIFYALAKSALSIIHEGWSTSAALRLWLHTSGRLLIVGVFLYTSIVWWNAPVSALIAGLSMLVAPLLASGLDPHRKH